MKKALVHVARLHHLGEPLIQSCLEQFPVRVVGRVDRDGELAGEPRAQLLEREAALVVAVRVVGVRFG
jgi:hypothetical protein